MLLNKRTFSSAATSLCKSAAHIDLILINIIKSMVAHINRYKNIDSKKVVSVSYVYKSLDH